MRRLTNYDLIMLFYLLQGGTLEIPYEEIRLSEDAIYRKFDTLEYMIVAEAKQRTGNLFCGRGKDGVYEISLPRANKNILEIYLQKYCSELMNDHLKGRFNVLKWNVARQEFIKRLVESNYNLNDLHISSIRSIHSLVPELIKFDYDLDITIGKRVSSPANADQPVSRSFANLYKNFKFECTLNLSSIVEELKKTTSATDYRKKH